MQVHHGLWFFLTTLLLALILAVYPLSPQWSWWRPDWVLLLLVFWVITHPELLGIGVAWLLGLFLDVLQGAALGGNAFAFCVIAYFLVLTYQRLRMYSLLMQSLVVLCLSLFHLVVVIWVQNLQGLNYADSRSLLSVLTTAVVWPFLYSVLIAITRRVVW